jgi:biopolymer transport protein ExbD
MARLQRKYKIGVDVPMAAMSDVAFLLIIFFIVTSSFSRPRKLPLELPGDQAVSAETVKPSPPPSVRVGVARVSLNDAPLQVWQLSGDLRTLLLDKPQLKDRVVILRADDDVPMERVVEVMDAIRSAEASVGFLELDAK